MLAGDMAVVLPEVFGRMLAPPIHVTCGSLTAETPASNHEGITMIAVPVPESPGTARL
jgi:hypothetical protein